MKNNDVDVIHLATGLIVGYPPCPRIVYFKNFIEEKFNVKVVYGTHPIPEKYYQTHKKIGTWESSQGQNIISNVFTDKEMRIKYN